MKKNIFSLFIILIMSLFLVGCQKEEQQKETPKEKKHTFSFYQEEKKDRYEAYKKEHPELSEKNVIIQVNIGLDYPYYSHVQQTNLSNPTQLLVNKYFYLGEDFVPENLEEIDKTYSKGGISLQKIAKDAFQEMTQKAKEDGITIRAISAYRSYAYQSNLYNRYVKEDGVEAADTYSARAGFSEHQTGLCVDVDDQKLDFNQFEASKSFQWMQENAHLYGFILRYPKGKEEITGYQYEAWHYRYVGKKQATYIKEHDITYDEYYMEFLDQS